MKLTIHGKELVVTIKSTTELKTEQVVMAHQLATGDYQALFINENEDESIDEYKGSPVAFPPYLESIPPYVKPSGTFLEPGHKPARINLVEKGDWVESEILCPFCGHTGKTGTRWGSSFCKCPACKGKLYNRLATGTAGETNKYGCHYVADEPMKFRMSEDEFADMIKEENND